jgi:thymidylate synthase
METILPPIHEVRSLNFNQAWLQLLRNCSLGKEIVFGDKFNPKPAKDTVQTIILEGDAIQQIEKKSIHPDNPFKLVKQYCNEFTWSYLKEYDLKPEDAKFAYMYFDRLARYNGFINQLQAMRDDLAVQIGTGISSNRSQAITWEPEADMGNVASPCLQRIRIRHEGDGKVSVHFDWRSRDAWGAWQSNLIALIDMLYREVIDPNDCIIVRIVDKNDSLHVYKRDYDAVRALIKKSFFWACDVRTHNQDPSSFGERSKNTTGSNHHFKQGTCPGSLRAAAGSHLHCRNFGFESKCNFGAGRCACTN